MTKQQTERAAVLLGMCQLSIFSLETTLFVFYLSVYRRFAKERTRRNAFPLAD